MGVMGATAEFHIGVLEEGKIILRYNKHTLNICRYLWACMPLPIRAFNLNLIFFMQYQKSISLEYLQLVQFLVLWAIESFFFFFSFQEKALR